MTGIKIVCMKQKLKLTLIPQKQREKS
jgi:hypothetical protein